MVGVSRAAVTIAIGEERLKGAALGPFKKLRLPDALDQWRANKGGEDGAAIAREEDGPDDEDDDDDDSDQLGAFDTADQLPAAQDKAVEPGSIRFEKARGLRLKNERLETELAVERGTLVSKAEMENALADAGVAIARDLDSIASWADALDAVERGDVAAMRALLRDKVRQLRTDIAHRLVKLDANAAQVEDDAE